MSSRLASLLVQDGLVSAKKMAQAFQRQVIYGGTLDTILLEMDLIDEPLLLEAMGRASGFPIAGDLPSREWLDSAGVRDWFPHALSERFRAVPVSLDGNVLRVLVTDPPDRKQLDELGYLISRSVDPIVVPEHRFAHAVEMVYGIAVPARFGSLAAKVRQRATELATRAPAPRSPLVAAVAPIPAITPVTAPAPVAAPIASIESHGERTHNIPTIVPTPEPPAARDVVPSEPLAKLRPATPSAMPEPERARSVVSDVPLPVVTMAPAATPMAVPTVVIDQPTPRMTPRQADAPAAVSQEVTVTVRGAVPTDAAAVSLAEAARRIDAAADRDAIFEALCRGARSELQFVSLLMVHGEVAVGRLALGLAWVPRESVAQMSVPLDKPSAFRAAALGKAPYLGRLGEDNVSAQALSALGRKAPLPALLVPIVLKDRAVALLYGDADGEPIDAARLGDLSTLVAAAGRSFQRLILKQKGADYGKAPKAGDSGAAKLSPAAMTAAAGDGNGAAWRPASAAAAGGEHTDEQGRNRLTVKGYAALSSAVTQPLHDAPTQPVAAGPSMTDADALVLSVLRDDDHAARSAEALVLLADRAVEVVVKHLPGPLRLDRHTLRGPTPPLSEHGPLLAVLQRLGAGTLRPLLARAQDPSLEVRYYVTLALGELRVAEAVPALGQRLFDADAGVRHAAMNALRQFEPSRELRTLTESLRGELPGPELSRQRFAADALGALRDVPSVPRLVELVKHTDEKVVTAARRALVEITKQDFGTSRWRWRSWWERHRHEPRMEWLLEGLGHPEAEVRLSASEELRTLSSEYFGYHFDLPKREREEARRKWVEWWRTHGQKLPKA
jgi:hypothetical protein